MSWIIQIQSIIMRKFGSYALCYVINIAFFRILNNGSIFEVRSHCFVQKIRFAFFRIATLAALQLEYQWY